MPESNEKLGIYKIPIEAETAIYQLNTYNEVNTQGLPQGVKVSLWLLAHKTDCLKIKRHSLESTGIITILYKTRKKLVVKV